MNTSIHEKIKGCFIGLMTGDAIAKQTENLTYEEIQAEYAGGIKGFEGTIGDIIPRYLNRHYDWKFGETTDDTEQSISIARVLSKNKYADHTMFGEEYMLCKKSNRPTLSLGRFQISKDPSNVLFEGDGSGAAMRVAPIGAIYNPSELTPMVSTVFESCIPTHGGQISISSAAAVAMAVSAAIDGIEPSNIIELSIKAATEAEKYRPTTSDFSVPATIYKVYNHLLSLNNLDPEYISKTFFPKKVDFIVPVAISLGVLTGSCEKSILLSANIGGDSDTVAAMAGAISGALNPNTINTAWFDDICKINSTELIDLISFLTTKRFDTR